MGEKPPFWKVKKLHEMSPAEWESLCDGCGQCCMHKLEDEDSGAIYATSVACQLLDGKSCLCCDYANRQSLVPDCLYLTLDVIKTARWLPKSCGYRQVYEGRDLEWWHPLVSGDPKTVHEAGISVRGTVKVHENALTCDEDYLRYIIGPLDGGR